VPARDLRWRKSVPLKGRVSLHFDSRFEWPRPDRPARSDRGFCHGLSTHFGVLTDGTVVPCCLDKDGVIDLGNLRTQNLHEVLQSARAEALRDGFQKAVLVEDLCRKCPFIARFDAKARRIIAGQRSTPARPRP
ncbi:MAG TPA: SPASM domain-containing protein, partial [Elusimicrobiota bacterium]|nr:SPASM domain-containing protein [Elusimicrobiota bacterium]